MANKLFLTSTLPYSNSSEPGKAGHVGHLLEFTITDALAKYYRTKLGKENVRFGTGLDEHGIKVYQKAQELNIPVKEYLEANYKGWIEFCNLFEIEYDTFYRTSSDKHHENVKKFWLKCFEKGDLYKKLYSGRYCIGCEAYKFDKDLVDGKCIDHSTIELKIIEEENWFFKFSTYREQLLLWIDNHQNFLSPDNKKTELRNLILDLEDIPVSRLKSKLPHGVDVPNDSEQVMYIWIEALYSYCLSCGHFEDENKFNGWWNNVLICCGPDNLRYQAVILQAMIASEGLNHTNKLLVHGTVLSADGRKMSKTDGNVVDPIKQLKKFGLDAVRYYTLAGLNTYENSSWSENELIELYNSHLANEFGNLVNRVLHLIDSKNINFDNEELTYRGKFWQEVTEYKVKVQELWSAYAIKEALHETNQLVKLANKYINDEAPWDKNCSHPAKVLSNLYYTLVELQILYEPVFSKEKSAEFRAALDTKTKIILFPKIEKEPITA